MLTLVSEFCVLPSPTSSRCTHLPPSLLPRLAHWSIFGCLSPPPHRCSLLETRQACCKPCRTVGWRSLSAQHGFLSVSLCPLYAYQYQVFTPPPPTERIVGATPFGWYTLPSWWSSKFFLALAVLPTFITVSLHIYPVVLLHAGYGVAHTVKPCSVLFHFHYFKADFSTLIGFPYSLAVVAPLCL